MVSSRGDDSDDEPIDLLQRERSVAQASRNIRCGIANDSDEDLDALASASLQASRAKLYGSDDCCIRLSKKQILVEYS